MNSWKRIKKWSSAMAALGWLWLAVGGSLHFHEAASAPQTNEHCAVCHALPQIKAPKTPAPFQAILPELSAAVLDVRCAQPSTTVAGLPTRSRSPPLS